MAAEAVPVHIVIPTHTSRWLAETLAGVSWQTVRPASVTVSSDKEEGRIVEVAREWAGRVGAPLRVVMRPFQGEARLNQIRNNGLRVVRDYAHPGDDDLVIILDGDTVLEPRAVEKHAALGAAGADMVIPFRVMMSEEASKGATGEAILSGAFPLKATAAERAVLEKRHRRYERQLFMRRFGLTKGHKPKTLGGHHAVKWKRYVQVNGYDEAYEGYGCDDDDLARRLHMLRPRPRVAIAVRDIMAFHLWHASRAGEGPKLTSGYSRFRVRGLPVRAELGLETEREQTGVRVEEV